MENFSNFNQTYEFGEISFDELLSRKKCFCAVGLARTGIGSDIIKKVLMKISEKNTLKDNSFGGNHK